MVFMKSTVKAVAAETGLPCICLLLHLYWVRKRYAWVVAWVVLVFLGINCIGIECVVRGSLKNSLTALIFPKSTLRPPLSHEWLRCCLHLSLVALRVCVLSVVSEVAAVHLRGIRAKLCACESDLKWLWRGHYGLLFVLEVRLLSKWTKLLSRSVFIHLALGLCCLWHGLDLRLLKLAPASAREYISILCFGLWVLLTGKFCWTVHIIRYE